MPGARARAGRPAQRPGPLDTGADGRHRLTEGPGGRTLHRAAAEAATERSTHQVGGPPRELGADETGEVLEHAFKKVVPPKGPRKKQPAPVVDPKSGYSDRRP